MHVSKFVSLVALLSLFLGQFAFAQQQSENVLSSGQGFEKSQPHKSVCGEGNKPEVVHCHAHVITDQSGKPQASASPAAYGPLQLRTAYGLIGNGSPSQIIAIVDAYNHPNIQADLDAYSATFGIPSLPACVGPASASAVACFQKVDQRGGTAYPSTDPGWALEIAMDVESAHAICQNCSIVLVEADSAGLTDLFTAVDQAVAQGAKAISNSYGTSQEFSGEKAYDSHFNHPGIAITVSTGDSGYRTSYPAVSPYVTAVGGTSLYLNADNSYNRETAWNGSGSGCSSQETVKPAGQPTLAGCSRRVIADVSAVADPNTGAAVYDSVPYGGSSGWFKVGGTSLSSPIIAAIYAMAGDLPSATQGNAYSYAHGNSSTLHDVVGGTTGRCRTPLCTAVTGFDGPTGLGSPKGMGAF